MRDDSVSCLVQLGEGLLDDSFTRLGHVRLESWAVSNGNKVASTQLTLIPNKNSVMLIEAEPSVSN